MTSTALTFMLTIWSVIFCCIAITLRPLLKKK
jgi:hypothetical protein